MKSYVIITGFILFAIVFAICCYLIWVNRADVKAISLFGKTIILPAVIAIGLLFNELWLNPTVEEKQTTNLMLIHNKGLRIGDFSNIDGVGRLDYSIINSTLEVWRQSHSKEKKYEVQKENIDTFYLDLVAASFINWMAFHYQQHWDSSWQDKVNLFTGQMLSLRVAEDAEKTPYEVNWDILKKIFSENEFIRSGPASYPFNKIYLPSGTKIHYIKDKNFQKIIFKTKSIELTINFRAYGGQDLEASEIGKKFKKLINLPISNNNTTSRIYLISFNYKVSPWRRWSFPTKKQLEWVRNLSDGFRRSYDWQMIWDRLESLGMVPKRY